MGYYEYVGDLLRCLFVFLIALIMLFSKTLIWLVIILLGIAIILAIFYYVTYNCPRFK